MRYKLIFEVAKGLLIARWKQTLVAAIGVTFSITMFITLLSFMTGLNSLLDGLILNRTPHIRMYREIKPNDTQPIDLKNDESKHHNFIHSIKPKAEKKEIYQGDAIIKSLRKDNRVLGVAPKVLTQVFFNVGPIDLTGAINGVDVKEEDRLYFFRNYVTTGNFQDLENIPNSIILGKGAAEQMLAKLGDVVQVTTAKGERFQLKVVGYFQSGILDIDKVQSYTSIATAQKLLGVPRTYVTDIQVKLKDIVMAGDLAKEYAKIYGVDAIDIQTANSQFETGTKVRNIISYAVGITLLVVSGFGIYNILNMMIYEKMDSIAILKATGFSGMDVNGIFISIALSIGLFGGMLGLLFGNILSTLISHIPFETAALPTVKTFPINYDPVFYFIGFSFSLITTYFAGYFPAKKASKIDPVLIIRGK